MNTLRSTPAATRSRSTPSARLFSALVAAGLAVAAAPSAQAGSVSWTGLGTDSVWTTNTNWFNNASVAPASNTATFDGLGNGKTTIALGAAQNATAVSGNLAFNTTSAAAYTVGLTGDTLSFVNNTTVLTMTGTGTTTQTIGANVLFNATPNQSATFDNSSLGELVINGGISSTATGRTFGISGTGNTTINGVIGTNITKLAKSGTGTLTLTNTSTALTTTTVSGGTLELKNAGTSNVDIALGALTLSAADVTLKSNQAGTGTLSTTFSSLARTSGNTTNIVSTTGTNGTSNSVKITGQAAGFIDKGVYFNGADFAAMDASGFVRALNYATTGGDLNTVDVNTLTAGKHVKLDSSKTQSTNISLLSLKLAGGGVNYKQTSGTLTVPGIIKSGGGASSTISGNFSAGTGVELVVRTDTSSDLLNINSVISGSSAVTKSGAGTLTLSLVNTYTGLTKVNAGTLLINGSTSASSAVTVFSGATLGGAGTVGGATTIASGGFLSAGADAASIGTLKVNNALTLSGTYKAKIANGTADCVTLAGSGAAGVLTLGATNSLTLVDSGATAGSYTLASYASKGGSDLAVGTNPFGQSNAALHGTVTAGATATTLALYNVAAANTLDAVDLGNIRAGTSTFTSQALTITNTKAASVSEGLNATASAATGVASFSGTPISNLSGNTSSTSILVGLTDNTAGAKSGTVSIGFASNGTASGFANSTLATQTVSVSGTAYDYASASFSSTSIDFGTVNSGQTYTATFNLKAAAGTRDSLSGTFTLSDGTLTSSDIGAVSALGAADTRSITLRYLAGAAGAYSGSLTFNGTSNGAALGLDSKTLAAISFNISANVVDASAIPEPATYAVLAGLGILILAAYRRRKTS